MIVSNPGDTNQVTTTNDVSFEQNTEVNDFNDYWFSGKAELSSYELKQSRYGEIHDGEVVLVFVTEPFSLSKQVKLDYPKESGLDKVSVMKLNQSRKFNTGIYDYSILSSVFTPIDIEEYPHTLKTTTSMQEWCGHSYTQLNLQNDNYAIKQFSYFESEGDEEKQIKTAQLEDGLMTKIRINNGQLPEGEMNLIPSAIYSRFTHNTLKPSKAKISKTETESRMNYEIKYLNINRTITIEVEKVFPYKIMGWTEDNGDGLLTTAKLKASTNQPYWAQHNLADEEKRKKLLQLK